MSPFTVIIPVKNEAKSLPLLLRFLHEAKPAPSEIIFMDGRSTDNTREIIESHASRDQRIKLIDNPKGFVPYGLNQAITQSGGDPVIRLDAHTEYAADYFEQVLKTFERTGADIVGGPMRARGTTALQQAVAYCTSTGFGIGDSSFHDEKAEGEAESVYLGAWKRRVFEKAGYFDEEMLRNQDDEFHYRARSKGLTIYLNPAIRSWYQPRGTWKSLFRQYFQYGLFKPLVLKKVSSGLRLRHLIPAGFALYLITLAIGYYFFGLLFLFPLFIYLLLDIRFAMKMSGRKKERIMALGVYPVLHIAYGSGFILGLLGMRKLFLRA
jgi:glycosyltransferase involved in cell wall biosynthesis